MGLCGPAAALLAAAVVGAAASGGGGAPAAAPRIDPARAEVSCDAILEFAFPDLCELEVERGSLKVSGLSLAYWKYRRRGCAELGVPVVMVHGGPAMNHNYMLPLKQQACRCREVVFYDQVGAGESAQPLDPRRSAPWLFEIDYYVRELSALVTALGWKEFHLLGNSWGTIVGQAYALSQDPRLRAVVLSGPLSDAQLYGRSQWDPEQGNLGSLPPFVQAALRRLEGLKAFDSALYAAEDRILTSFFTVRTTPMPDCVQRAFAQSETSKDIYVGMQGASEFVIGGVLTTFNFTHRLPEIRNPVLLTHGRYDTMRPPVVDAMYRSFPRAWRALMPHSGHMSMVDDPRLMNDVVGAFLRHEERGTLAEFEVPGEASEDTGRCGAPALSAAGSEAPAAPSQWLPAALGVVAGAGLGAAATSAVLLRHRRDYSAPPLLS